MSAPRTAAWDAAAATPDPELPLLTIGDLGILRDVQEQDGRVVATITPTYSGCPAMREIAADLERRLRAAGFAYVEVQTQLAPPWSTDCISETGRRKLAAAGIAAPSGKRITRGPVPLTLGAPPAAACPRCGSAETVRTAAFGATACKSLHRCSACGEPFEAMKVI